jgi:hypothetical protein
MLDCWGPECILSLLLLYILNLGFFQSTEPIFLLPVTLDGTRAQLLRFFLTFSLITKPLRHLGPEDWVGFCQADNREGAWGSSHTGNGILRVHHGGEGDEVLDTINQAQHCAVGRGPLWIMRRTEL